MDCIGLAIHFVVIIAILHGAFAQEEAPVTQCSSRAELRGRQVVSMCYDSVVENVADQLILDVHAAEHALPADGAAQCSCTVTLITDRFDSSYSPSAYDGQAAGSNCGTSLQFNYGTSLRTSACTVPFLFISSLESTISLIRNETKPADGYKYGYCIAVTPSNANISVRCSAYQQSTSLTTNTAINTTTKAPTTMPPTTTVDIVDSSVEPTTTTTTQSTTPVPTTSTGASSTVTEQTTPKAQNTTTSSSTNQSTTATSIQSTITAQNTTTISTTTFTQQPNVNDSTVRPSSTESPDSTTTMTSSNFSTPQTSSTLSSVENTTTQSPPSSTQTMELTSQSSAVPNTTVSEQTSTQMQNTTAQSSSSSTSVTSSTGTYSSTTESNVTSSPTPDMNVTSSKEPDSNVTLSTTTESTLTTSSSEMNVTSPSPDSNVTSSSTIDSNMTSSTIPGSNMTSPTPNMTSSTPSSSSSSTKNDSLIATTEDPGTRTVFPYTAVIGACLGVVLIVVTGLVIVCLSKKHDSYDTSATAKYVVMPGNEKVILTTPDDTSDTNLDPPTYDNRLSDGSMGLTTFQGNSGHENLAYENEMYGNKNDRKNVAKADIDDDFD